ncbi:hypothetical protein KY347_03690 [Candidatus Woesearchaeota archaeon]|nr:hypothetical protein [Candidatus Woesearchaeota archaeon]
MKKFKAIAVLICAFLLSASIAYADSVAYILSNVDHPEQKLIDILEDMGLTVDKIDDEDISSVNLQQYDFMLINDGTFSNYNSIPVNNFPALILNTNYIDDWHWTSRVSQKSSSQPLRAYVNDPTKFITMGFPSEIQIYTSSSPSVSYLHRYYKAPQLETLISTGSSTTERLNAIIAAAKPGTLLRDSVTSNVKSVFFGITEDAYWTSNTEQLFRNSVSWLITDFIPPQISNLAVTDITNSSALISWDTDKDANSTVLYGGSTSLTESKSSPATQLHHEILLDSLSEKTTYYYKAKSCNENNYCRESTISDFTTLDLTAPYLSSHAENYLTNSYVTIYAETNEDSYSTVYYGTSPSSLTVSTAQSALDTSASFEINDLNEKTAYYYKVEMCDDSGNCRDSEVFSFETLDLTAPNAPENLEITGSDIVLAWDSALDDTVAYNIYISDDPYNFDFSSPNATTAENSYVDSTAGSVKQRYYVIRAEDAAGNEESNTYVLGKYDVELKVGYNLIALPLVPLSSDIDDVMHQSVSYNPVSEVKKFDSSAQGFKTNGWVVAAWNPLAFQEMKYGEGYFLKSKQNTDFTFVGTLPETVNREIKQGMNLFGIASLENKNIGEVIAQTPADYKVIEIGKRNSDGTYSLATYYASGWSNPFTLETGAGYWLKSNQDFNLELNP